MFSNWLFSKYAECIDNVHCTPRTAPRLRSDRARCFWCVNVTSTDPFFHWVKLLIFFLFSGILKPILFMIFHEHGANDFVFLSCMNYVNKFAFTFAREIRQIQSTCLNLMLVQCTRPCGPQALDASKFSARALDLSYFYRKSKCAFINL